MSLNSRDKENMVLTFPALWNRRKVTVIYTVCSEEGLEGSHTWKAIARLFCVPPPSIPSTISHPHAELKRILTSSGVLSDAFHNHGQLQNAGRPQRNGCVLRRISRRQLPRTRDQNSVALTAKYTWTRTRCNKMDGLSQVRQEPRSKPECSVRIKREEVNSSNDTETFVENNTSPKACNCMHNTRQ